MSFIMASGAESLSFFQKFGIEWDMLLSQAIMFTLLALILYRFVFRPVSKAADERRVKIEQLTPRRLARSFRLARGNARAKYRQRQLKQLQ